MKAEGRSKMDVHVAAASAARGEDGVRGVIATDPSVLVPKRRPSDSAPADRRREIRCRGGDDWRRVRGAVTVGDGDAVR
jgi:hypothetical protein